MPHFIADLAFERYVSERNKKIDEAARTEIPERLDDVIEDIDDVIQTQPIDDELVTAVASLEG